jgi:hypothetical protein
MDTSARGAVTSYVRLQDKQLWTSRNGVAAKEFSLGSRH